MATLFFRLYWCSSNFQRIADRGGTNSASEHETSSHQRTLVPDTVGMIFANNVSVRTETAYQGEFPPDTPVLRDLCDDCVIDCIERMLQNTDRQIHGEDRLTDELDMQLHEALAEQQRALRRMTKAQRHRYFEKMFLTDFKMEIDRTTYIVCQHYTPTAKETLAEKAERIAKEAL